MAVLSKEVLPPWGNALAGATGAVLANAVVYPLDIVKTRLQVQSTHDASTSPLGMETPLATNSSLADKDSTVDDAVDPHYTSTADAIQKIVADEGVAGLYSGMASSLIGVASTNFAYFYWYSVARALYLSSSSSSSTPSPLRSTSRPPPGAVVELGLGAIAGALAQVFTIPVAVVTTRQQTQRKGQKKGLFDTGREVVNGEDGWTGLWRGLKASLVLVVNPAITYGAYQSLRERLFPGKATLRPWEAFVLGALCKALATILTQPLIVAKVGLQSRPPPGRRGRPFKSFVEVMRYIVRHEGVSGLAKGIGPQLMKGLLVQGLLMMTKERTELLFILLFRYVRSVRSRGLRQAAEALRGMKVAVPLTVK